MFEYILGNHTYINMFLLSPLTWFWNHPILIIFTTITTHFVTMWSLFYLVKLIMPVRHYKVLTAIIISWLFICSRNVFENFNEGVWMFNPDFFFPPLSIFLLISAIKDSKKYFLISSILILTTKEEAIALYIVLYIWCYA